MDSVRAHFENVVPCRPGVIWDEHLCEYRGASEEWSDEADEYQSMFEGWRACSSSQPSARLPKGWELEFDGVAYILHGPENKALRVPTNLAPDTYNGFECRLLSDFFAEMLAAPSIAEKRELTIDNAPVGTKAPSITGAHWIKTERGWRWCNSSVSFPRPGGDWNGELILPNDMQHSESSEIPNDQ